MSAFFVPSSEPRSLEDMTGIDRNHDEVLLDDDGFRIIDAEATEDIAFPAEDPGVPFDSHHDRMIDRIIRDHDAAYVLIFDLR